MGGNAFRSTGALEPGARAAVAATFGSARLGGEGGETISPYLDFVAPGHGGLARGSGRSRGLRRREPAERTATTNRRRRRRAHRTSDAVQFVMPHDRFDLTTLCIHRAIRIPISGGPQTDDGLPSGSLIEYTDPSRAPHCVD